MPSLVRALALLLALGCGGKAAGSACVAGECRQGLECVSDAHGGQRCMAPCAAGTRLCADGSVCLDPGAGLYCWFGGGVSIGAGCTSSLDCEPGTVCEAGACEQACTVGVDAPCDTGQACVATASSATDGVCAVVLGPADAAAGP